MGKIVSYLLLLGCLSSVSAKDLFTYDSTFVPDFPIGGHTYSGVGVGNPSGLVFITQRGNSSVEPVQVFNKSTGAFLHGWGSESVGLDHSVNPSSPTWGAHGIAVEECNWGCGGEPYPNLRIWIDDFTNHTLTAYTALGERLLQMGTNGIAGNGTHPLQFGSLADTATEVLRACQ